MKNKIKIWKKSKKNRKNQKIEKSKKWKIVGVFFLNERALLKRRIRQIRHVQRVYLQARVWIREVVPRRAVVTPVTSQSNKHLKIPIEKHFYK